MGKLMQELVERALVERRAASSVAAATPPIAYITSHALRRARSRFGCADQIAAAAFIRERYAAAIERTLDDDGSVMHVCDDCVIRTRVPRAALSESGSDGDGDGTLLVEGVSVVTIYPRINPWVIEKERYRRTWAQARSRKLSRMRGVA